MDAHASAHIVSPASVPTAAEIGISVLESPLNNAMLAFTKGKSSITYPLLSLGAVYRKGSSPDRDGRLSTIRYLDEADLREVLSCEWCTYPNLGLTQMT